MNHARVSEITSIQRLARFTGLLYLILVLCGMFSPIVLESLVAPGDAATTADNINKSLGLFRMSLLTWIVVVVADVTASVTFYVLLEPVSRLLSLVAAAFRLVYSAILGGTLLYLFEAYSLLTHRSIDIRQAQTMALSALDRFSAGFQFALIFFGVHLVALGFLLYRSRYVPRTLGVLLAAAGIGYVVDSLAKVFVANYGSLASAILLLPAILGELGLTVWLLVKGVEAGCPTASINK